jgi:hypothetical protein
MYYLRSIYSDNLQIIIASLKILWKERYQFQLACGMDFDAKLIMLSMEMAAV